MLMLTRRISEALVIGDDITVTSNEDYKMKWSLIFVFLYGISNVSIAEEYLHGNPDTTYQDIGNTMYVSDESTYQYISNKTYGSDGSTSERTEITSYDSYGSISQQIDNTLYGYNGSTVQWN